MGFQTGGAIVDFVVLAILNKKDEYGYILTQEVRNILDISETAMYPVLKRLQKTGLLDTYDNPANGRNRRFYRITEEGKENLKLYKKEWQTFKDHVDLLMKEREDEDLR